MAETAPGRLRTQLPVDAGKAIDPRIVRSRAAVLTAARALLSEGGFGGATIDAIAARSGVAKTTIYRQWPGCNELIIDAFSFDSDPITFPTTDDLRADLSVGLRFLAKELSSGDWIHLLPAMLEAAERDEEFLRMSRAFIDSRRKPLKDRLQIATKRGELALSADVEILISLLVGPLFYRRLVVHQPIGRNLVDEILDMVLGQARPKRAR